MRAEAMVCNSEGSAYVWPTLHMRGGSLPSTRPKIHSPGKVCSQAAVLLVSGHAASCVVCIFIQIDRYMYGCIYIYVCFICI